MPRLSSATRDQRRLRILDAARACVDEYGLEAVSMEMIVARTGMSTGAVYRYFAGKEDIIRAAVIDGTTGAIDAIEPILTQAPPLPPGPFLTAVLTAVLGYSTSGDTDLTGVAVHGWSHSRSDDTLRAEMCRAQRRLRTGYSAVARHWQAAGIIDPSVDPAEIGQLLLSLTLGYVAQLALTGDASVQAHAAALDAFTSVSGNSRRR
ncbi:TetR/AcrR family transcriptional regulator [Tsukamurella soli]|uniref:HTH tetR-type domain-containing protein n=1 Tax=Tsukamurella soli TaxID=644556 RepID=A0ABP8JI05_9ACTN